MPTNVLDQRVGEHDIEAGTRARLCQGITTLHASPVIGTIQSSSDSPGWPRLSTGDMPGRAGRREVLTVPPDPRGASSLWREMFQNVSQRHKRALALTDVDDSTSRRRNSVAAITVPFH